MTKINDSISNFFNPGLRSFIMIRNGIIPILILAVLIIPARAELNSPSDLADSLNSEHIVYFDFGKWDLKEAAIPILNELAQTLKENPDYTLHITGHTDNIGTDEFNFELSEKRAQSVKEYLISSGCSENKIIITAKGKEEPLNDNLTDQDRAINRRVVFSIIMPEKAKEEDDRTFVNMSFNEKARNEIKVDLSVRDTAGKPIEDVKEEDVSAVLKWSIEEVEDSLKGSVYFIPIDDKKKIAFSLTMDYSGSMYGSDNAYVNMPKSEKITAMEQAVKSFIRELKSNMFCKIVKFGENVDEIIRYTKSKEVLEKAVDSKSFPRGGTALYSSIYACLMDTTYQSNPTISKTVISFTDGMENSSRDVTLEKLYAESIMRNTKVFTIGLFSELSTYTPTEQEKQRGVQDLLSIANNCGGFFYRADNPAQLTNIYQNIFAQILKSYQVSIIWNEEKLPPKGTRVKAVVRVNVKGKTRVLYKDYVIE